MKTNMKMSLNAKMDNFCAFILTHGRPDNVITLHSIRKHGYTGKIYLVVDDQDKTLPQYQEKYGDQVLVFSKEEISTTFDEGDNFDDRRVIVYARNACFKLAEQVGCKYFIQLDDDYTQLRYRFTDEGFYKNRGIKNLDAIWRYMLDYYKAIPALSIAMSQGGDFIGGSQGYNAKSIKTRRKAMNSFICSTERPFKFIGRINEDVNTYTTLAHTGALFLTILAVDLNQKETQSNAGGMTDIYQDGGTYRKSFYSVMYSPSSVKITLMGNTAEGKRIHHRVKWKNAAPMIINSQYQRHH